MLELWNSKEGNRRRSDEGGRTKGICVVVVEGGGRVANLE